MSNHYNAGLPGNFPAGSYHNNERPLSVGPQGEDGVFDYHHGFNRPSPQGYSRRENNFGRLRSEPVPLWSDLRTSEHLAQMNHSVSGTYAPFHYTDTSVPPPSFRYPPPRRVEVTSELPRTAATHLHDVNPDLLPESFASTTGGAESGLLFENMMKAMRAEWDRLSDFRHTASVNS